MSPFRKHGEPPHGPKSPTGPGTPAPAAFLSLQSFLALISARKSPKPTINSRSEEPEQDKERGDMQGQGSRLRWGLRAGWWHRKEAGGLSPEGTVQGTAGIGSRTHARAHGTDGTGSPT